MNEHRGLWRGKHKIYHNFESEQDVFEWVEGYYVSNGENLHYIITDNFVQYLVDPKTLGECTGLRDKNKKLIFEGDIVEIKGNIGRVIFVDDEAGFVVDTDKKYFTMSFSSECEIVGNIHDNPDLLTPNKT